MATDAVFFTAESALRLARIAGVGKRDFAQRKVHLPESFPLKTDLISALATVQTLYPSFSPRHPVHVLSGTDSRRKSPEGFKVHRCASNLPSGSFWRIAKGVFAATPPFALAQIAAHETNRIELLKYIWEACGTYQTPLTGHCSAYQVPPLTDTSRIERFVARCDAPGTARLRGLLRYVRDDSASARETQLALLLGLPTRFGGYGMGIPLMNIRVKTDRQSRESAGRKSFVCDVCWPDKKLDVEYQSFEIHSNETSRIRDSRRANALASMGWTVVGVTNDELDSMAAMDGIAKAIAATLEKRIRVRIEDYDQRKRQLRRQLGLPLYGLDDIERGAWHDR